MGNTRLWRIVLALVILAALFGAPVEAAGRSRSARYDPSEYQPGGTGHVYNDPVPVATHTPQVKPKKIRDMSGLEQGFWTAAKSLGAATGSTVGASVGMVAVPAAITAIVGALGISTSGAGFVSAVLIPYSPVIGKFVGSAVGAGLFTGVITTAYEVRMQKFRPQRKSGREIAGTVFKAAMTDALLAPVTLGLGGGGAAAASKGLGQMAKEVFKTASVRFLGTAILDVAGRAMGSPYQPAAEPASADGPPSSAGTPGLTPQSNAGFAGGVIPPMQAPDIGVGDSSSDGSDEDAGEGSETAPSVSISRRGNNGGTDRTNGAAASEGSSDEQVRSGSGAVGNGGEAGTEKEPGFSREVEQAAWESILSSRLGVMAVFVPRTIPGGISMRWFAAYAFKGNAQ